ncbi:unnamed protein product [Amoebophrya sp. A120]|nr:unnamed protein product [Amoebophrya sp. A120]|eukprot:GSA120T00009851001.1
MSSSNRGAGGGPGGPDPGGIGMTMPVVNMRTRRQSDPSGTRSSGMSNEAGGATGTVGEHIMDGGLVPKKTRLAASATKERTGIRSSNKERNNYRDKNAGLGGVGTGTATKDHSAAASTSKTADHDGAVGGTTSRTTTTGKSANNKSSTSKKKKTGGNKNANIRDSLESTGSHASAKSTTSDQGTSSAKNSSSSSSFSRNAATAAWQSSVENIQKWQHHGTARALSAVRVFVFCFFASISIFITLGFIYMTLFTSFLLATLLMGLIYLFAEETTIAIVARQMEDSRNKKRRHFLRFLRRALLSMKDFRSTLDEGPQIALGVMIGNLLRAAGLAD